MVDRRGRSGHPLFVFVPHASSFSKKISFGFAALERVVPQLKKD
jgi:hypothetical protein